MIVSAKIGDFINITCNLQHLKNIPKNLNKRNIYNENEDDDDEDDMDSNEQFEVSFSSNNDNYEIDWFFIDKNGQNNIIRLVFERKEK
jgi:hypothetical protein